MWYLLLGSFPVLSLMVGTVVTRLVPDVGPPANITGFEGLTQSQQRVLVASSMTFLVGIFQVMWLYVNMSLYHPDHTRDFKQPKRFLSAAQLAMGVLQVGFIVVYLSDTLVSGFTTAAAVHILVSQLKFVLGLTVPGISGPLSIIYVSAGCIWKVYNHPV